MRILINDFGGYSFPLELSRYLATIKYSVMHCYLSNIQTPHGNTNKSDLDSSTFFLEPIELKNEFKKYSPIGRYKGEIEYAKKIAEKIDFFKPDLVLSANTPLIAQDKILQKCKQLNIKFIYWCQDIHSIALEKFFAKKLFVLAKVFTSYFRKIEIRLLKESTHVVTISETFNEIFKKWGLSENHITIIHNWGPFNEIEILNSENEWSKKNKLTSKVTILYSGTLGLKHNPMLIAEACKKLLGNNDVVFVVISEGLGSNILLKQKELYHLENLIILPYQDYKILSQVLSSADILVAILEKDASLFSVPSKVFTYLCSGKAILLSVDKDNLSSKIIIENNAGFSTDPGNFDDFMAKLQELINNEKLRNTLGENGRKFASENFPIHIIAEKFIKVFKICLQ